MATKKQDEAVRNYLLALRDPDSLKDEDRIAELRKAIEQTDDELERLRLRQQLIDAERPAVEQFEQAFVEHAKAWADQHGISDRAFLAEGVPPRVLRKAGFTRVRGDGRRTRQAAKTGRRSRVSADDVRSALPKGKFTIKQVQDATGASPAVVRRVVTEEAEAGRVSDLGTDPDHKGPGRAPRLYER